MFPQFGAATADSLSRASTLVFRIGTDAHLYDDPDDVNIAPLLDSRFDSEKCEALKRLLALIAQGVDVCNFFPQVVKNVASQSLEVKKLAYLYLLQYAEKRPNEALLSINCFQKDLSDLNPLVRAWALRSMAGIHLHVVAPLVLAAIRKCARDPSSYVRKCAVNALSKLLDLLPEENTDLEELVNIFMSDHSLGVVGASAVAFKTVCLKNLSLISKHFRRLCESLPDIEEWGQITLIEILLRYVIARHGLVRESIMFTSNATESFHSKWGSTGLFHTFDNHNSSIENVPHDFKGNSLMLKNYIEGWEECLLQHGFTNGNAGEDQYHLNNVAPASIENDDVRILLQCTLPLLWSQNSAVVLAAVGVHWIMAPNEKVQRIVKPILFLLRSFPDSKYVIASVNERMEGKFIVVEDMLKKLLEAKSNPATLEEKENTGGHGRGGNPNMFKGRENPEVEILEGEDGMPHLESLSREEMSIGYERGGADFVRRGDDFDGRGAEFERRRGDFDDGVLCNIQVFAKVLPSLFAPYYEDFFVHSSEIYQIRALKLEILSAIVTDASSQFILDEFQDYIKDPDRRFVADTVAAIGICAQRLPSVVDVCLGGLLGLASQESSTSNASQKDGEACILVQAIMSIKSIIKHSPARHEKVIARLARNLDVIKEPSARALIIWIVGEYCSIGQIMPNIIPNILKFLAWSFSSEILETKHQILNTAIKETKWVREKAKEIDSFGFKLWYSSRSRTRNSIDVIIYKSLKDNVIKIDRIGDRIIALKIIVDAKIIIISVYAPQLVMDVLIRQLQEDVSWCMLFADDILFVDKTREGVEGKLELWRSTLELKGFCLSRSKTEYMECNFSSNRSSEGFVTLSDQVINKCTSFRYLGSIVQSDGEIYGDIISRIQVGWLNWRNASGLLCDRKVPLKFKGKFYKMVRPAMLYGTECWPLKEKHNIKLSVAEMRMLRWMSGLTLRDKIRNERIREKVVLSARNEDMLMFEKILNYILQLAKYDIDYDIRDRARMAEKLLSPCNAEDISRKLQNGGTAGEILENIFRGNKHPSRLPDNDFRFYLPGSLSHVVLHAALGYDPLPKPCSLHDNLANGIADEDATSGSFDSGSSIDESGSYNDSDPSVTSSVESDGNELASDSHDPNNPSSSITNIYEDRTENSRCHPSESSFVSDQTSRSVAENLTTSISSDLADLMSRTALESWLDEHSSLSSATKPSESSSVRISVNDLSFTVSPNLHTLLDPVNGNGLKVEYSFLAEASKHSPFLVCTELLLSNCSNELLTAITVEDGEPNKSAASSMQALEKPESLSTTDEGSTIIPIEEVTRLEPGQTIKRTLQVQFQHHLLPLKVAVFCNGRRYTVKLWPDIGYFIRPISMNGNSFVEKESELKGMFECTKRCSFEGHIEDLKHEEQKQSSLGTDKILLVSRSLASKVLSHANVFLVSIDMPVSFSDDDASGLRLRFSSEISRISKPCLISIVAEGKCSEPLNISVKVNCEETVFGLNLLNRFVAFLH
ncbi:hypothetical protein IEQ34_016489 [Dendrobium chrysotoxum]|uniref:AP-3 complex subunit beta C-terminal domain-containing protein n=1 Tax=Dendrobium chrysotoxum TaxID=161865 RepID=A0AAV7GFP7_DENCH|nr:hypothetical protein IEQ34_016489 [Dendrobium chrysotoxum]